MAAIESAILDLPLKLKWCKNKQPYKENIQNALELKLVLQNC